MSANGGGPLLEIERLTVEYARGRGRPPLRAVDDVSLSLAPRETVGLVGESGSGKTTIGRAILGLAPIADGAIRFDGVDITRIAYRRRRALSADLQVIFQDPYSSFNPTRTIGQTLSETLQVHGDKSAAEVAARVSAMLQQVGMPPEAARRYPAHFSGGQRQRIAIARALMASPRLVICDEPTSALDLSVQAQVMNLLQDLQSEFDLSYLFISHDLAVVRHLSHRIVVLYQGRVMEQGQAHDVYASPIHPYTKALLAAAPVPDPHGQRQRRAARARRAAGVARAGADACPFAPRCPHAIDVCRSERPPLETTPSGSVVACHRWREVGDESATEAAAGGRVGS
ncbi:MAG TPA: ABC transporter ATP-binding protein [Conexibacter sp.]|nr:ABC transporter ATP-binding protein [Conexibacter sp.]